VKNDPADAPLSIETTAKPLRTLVLILVAAINLVSIWVWYSADFSVKIPLP
jgi:hypothetical protein